MPRSFNIDIYNYINSNNNKASKVIILFYTALQPIQPS
jgi:hypothetical protein